MFALSANAGKVYFHYVSLGHVTVNEVISTPLKYGGIFAEASIAKEKIKFSGAIVGNKSDFKTNISYQSLASSKLVVCVIRILVVGLKVIKFTWVFFIASFI